jgi:hypothetical protein
MMLTRDLQVDWGQVPDIGQKLPSGFVQFKIVSFEERMTSAEGTKKDGTAKVAKYMIVCKVEGLAPDEAIGGTREEFFVLGSDADPLMSQAGTFYESIGARSLKRMLGDAQVPWSSSLVATLNSAVGAMFVAQVKHQKEKRSDTGEDFVGVRLGTTFKVGEKVPQYVPCALPECLMCQAARGVGGVGAVGAPSIPQVGAPSVPKMEAPPVYAGPNYPNPPVAPVIPAAPVAPVMPAAPAPAVPPFPTAPAATAPVTAPAAVVHPAPAATMVCKICGMADIPAAEFASHVAACAANAAAQATAGFRQES